MAEQHYQVWLFRHGATEWSESGQHTGRTDIPLTAGGKSGARAIGQRLKGRPFSLVLSSPLVRAVETCQLAGYGEDVQLTDDLMEWDYGDYEGRRTIDIQKGRPGWSLWSEGVPNGETVEQVGRRAGKVLDQAASVDGDVALFSHGHMLRVLSACWLGRPPTDGQLYALGTGAVCVLGFEHDYHVIRRWNESSHLVEVKDA